MYNKAPYFRFCAEMSNNEEMRKKKVFYMGQIGGNQTTRLGIKMAVRSVLCRRFRHRMFFLQLI